jgi:hypothetical protein
MHDAGDVVAPTEGEENVTFGDADMLHGDSVGEEGRDVCAAVSGDEDLLAQAEQCLGGMDADHREAAGDEDHRSTS